MVDKSSSPDYAAYSRMYDGSQATLGQLHFFGQIMNGARLISENFKFFQGICVLAGCYALRALFRFRSQMNPTSRSLNSLSLVILLLLSSVFFIEFYVIRLRAGLSVFFFLFAVISFLKMPFAVQRQKTAVVIGWLALSILTHVQTAMLLCLMVLPAMYLHRLQIKPRFSEASLFIAVTLVIWTVVFRLTSDSWVWRGEDLVSPLNPVRFFASAVVPLLILAAYVALIRKVPRWARFPVYFGVSYGTASLVLAGFFLGGMLEYDGEAVVRIMTLSSVGGLISIFGWGLNRYTLLPAYVVLANALFFLNTVFLQLNHTHSHLFIVEKQAMREDHKLPAVPER